MPATKKKTAKKKTETKTTRIGFVIDESGSMQGNEQSVIDGYNEFVATLVKEAPDAAKVFGTLAFFDYNPPDPNVRFKRDNVVFGQMPELAHRVDDYGRAIGDYRPRGLTPLNDAIAEMIGKLDEAAGEDDQVMLVIVTDGGENASKDIDLAGLRVLAEGREAAGWEFIYLGANVDSFSQARKIGLSGKAGQHANFVASPRGTANTMKRAGAQGAVYAASGSSGLMATSSVTPDSVSEDPIVAAAQDQQIKDAHEQYMRDQEEAQAEASKKTKADAAKAASGVFKKE